MNEVMKAFNKYLKIILHDSFKEIALNYKVTVDFVRIILAYHNEYSLMCNYPKGHSELLRDSVKDNSPNYSLF